MGLREDPLNQRQEFEREAEKKAASVMGLGEDPLNQRISCLAVAAEGIHVMGLGEDPLNQRRLIACNCAIADAGRRGHRGSQATPRPWRGWRGSDTAT